MPGRTTTKVSEPNQLPLLPQVFSDWFSSRGWQVRKHQLALIQARANGRSTLLIAPTGAGKTLAGFLPSLIDLCSDKKERLTRKKAPSLHTLYISPLKALSVDIARNLTAPVEEMDLDIRIETRTGDTPASRRQRQRSLPPDILLTTPEQVALMASHPNADSLFGDVRTIILDELHALVTSKRGDLLALNLARLRAWAPGALSIGLSATIARPSELRAFLVNQRPNENVSALADIITVEGGARPEVSILETNERLPWAGHSARYALPEIYKAAKAHRMTLIFVNTRSQAEMLFQELWHINEDNLPIALHHGSLNVGQRRKVESALVAGKLRAVVCTSTLDLGIDWGDVDLVVNVGAPKGASRLAQRIGRANHRLDEPSRALLIPANRFEVMECRAALDAAQEGAQDTPSARKGGLDVLAQHVLGIACSGPFAAAALYEQIRSAAPYTTLTREQFDRVIQFVATGGYALKSYDRFARIRLGKDGQYRISHPRLAQQYRLNVGTIVEAPMLKVRLGKTRGGFSQSGKKTAMRGGRLLGEVEEWFIEQLVLGDTFVFSGQVLRFEGLREMEVYVTRAEMSDPKIPSYQGGKFPLSTYLAERVRTILANESYWHHLPNQVSEWLDVQRRKSIVPKVGEVLVETFPRGRKHYLVCYPFEGRLAHQTLGMLLTRRLERARARPLGFVANEYALAIWGLRDLTKMVVDNRLDLADLFDRDMLGDDLDAWLAESSLMKRTFRICAVISGLIERRHPGKEKSGRQMTVSSDLIFDVLKSHEPNHILLEAAWADAAGGLLDIARLGEFLGRIEGRIRHIGLNQVSPLAVPVMLEIGRESVFGEANDDLLREAAGQLIEEAMHGI